MQINPKNLILSSDTFGILSCSCTSMYLNDPNLSSLVHYSNTARNEFNFFFTKHLAHGIVCNYRKFGNNFVLSVNCQSIILLTVQFSPRLSCKFNLIKCNDITLRHQKPTCKIQLLPRHFSRLDEAFSFLPL